MKKKISCFNMSYVASPINYIGGKYKLLPQILPLFPDGVNKFVDLFCGGCNVGINVNAREVIFNDIIFHLTEFYRYLKNYKLEDIISYIEGEIETFNLSKTNRDGFNKFRERYNSTDEPNPLDLFILVAHSFNHQIRFNNNHKYNSSFGVNRSAYNPKMKSNLIKFVERLKSINCCFHSKNVIDFDLSSLKLNHYDFVYADPPYLLSTGVYNDGKRGFTGWGQKEEAVLLDKLLDLHNKDIKFALSNVIEHKAESNSLLSYWVEKNKFKVNYLDKNYSNSSYQLKDRQCKTVEVLITNY